MKLFEIPRKPQLAGRAKLKFASRRDAARIRDTIHMPDHPEVEMFDLKKGDQFLARVGSFIGTEDRQNHIYFGGTDENPFLVRLKEDAMRPFMEGGEEAFFDALKPGSVKQIEKTFGVKARRQGDFFFVPLLMPWEEIDRLSLLFIGKGCDVEQVSKTQLVNTRHRITGKLDMIHIVTAPNMHVGEGIVTAPDHAPVELKGPHAIVQAHNLYDPPHAD